MNSRIARAIMGLALIGYGVYSGNYWFYLGAVPLITALVNWCPLENAMGTCDSSTGCCSSGEKSSESSCCSSKTDKEESGCCSTQSTSSEKSECCSTAPKAATPAWSTTKEPQTSCCSSSDECIKIEVLGTGCAKCKALEEVAKEATTSLSGCYCVEKVEDVQKIAEYGVVSTPALVVDGKVLSTGKLLSVEEVKALLA